MVIHPDAATAVAEDDGARPAHKGGVPEQEETERSTAFPPTGSE